MDLYLTYQVDWPLAAAFVTLAFVVIVGRLFHNLSG